LAGDRGEQNLDKCRTAGAAETTRRRRRGTALEDALLQAAWDEVSAVGYANLTMEGVAERAGTSKAVLYRRWPRRAELVLAAMRRHVVSIKDKVPDTGSLREDLLAVLRLTRQHFHEIGPDIAHGIMSERHDLPRDDSELMPEVMMTLLNRAAERGEIRLVKVTPLIAALPGDLLRHRLLLAGGEAPDAFLEEVVDDVFLPLVTAR
jgi:AcrR family transcriptional regulator